MAKKVSTKIRTKASSEPARFWDDEGQDSAEGAIKIRPSFNGNDFDIRMSGEADGVKAAAKVVDFLVRRGVCLVEANAPAELLHAAFNEAQQLWEDGEFAPPLRVSDTRSMLEARVWHTALRDDEKVVWVPTNDSAEAKKTVKQMAALRLLAGNIRDFAAGLGADLASRAKIDFDRTSQVMLSCYTGDRVYSLHVDNPHSKGEGDDQRLPDNGMRLTATYFLNTDWNPDGDLDSAGGLDLHLTDPASPPSSAAAAKIAPKLRIAPHADTLVLFLSERMAHRVIATQGSRQWFCMTLWALEGASMEQAARKLAEQEKQADASDNDDD